MTTTPLPKLYAKWMEELLGAELPGETRATCDDCVMCKPSATSALPDFSQFDPSIKCCTFMPSLPNFLVGMILDGVDTDREVRTDIVRRIREHQSATPLGLYPSRGFTARYDAQTKDGGFGRIPELICPYYLADGGGRCGLWAYRGAVCSTWFCQADRRAVGVRFWSAAKRWLLAIERTLAAHCLLELGIDRSVLGRLYCLEGTPLRLDKGEIVGWVDQEGYMDVPTAKNLWANWYGREEEWYVASAQIAASLKVADIQSLGGETLRVVEHLLVENFEQLSSDTIPEALCLGILEATPLDDTRVAVHTEENSFDPLVVSNSIFEALPLFDGRETSQATRAAEARGVTVDEATLRLLVDQGILLPPDGCDVPIRDRVKDPLSPESRLCFFRNYSKTEVKSETTLDEEGNQILIVFCGAKEIEFDDADLIDFGRQLVAHQNGFWARDAMTWAPPGSSHPWERVEELLSQLVAGEVLQIIPNPPKEGKAK